jgi:tetratricopeptide (TPR) repeat protein
MKRFVRSWAAASCIAGSALTGGTSSAQSDETSRTAAETLFVEAKKLMEAGKFAEACPKFADSQRLDPGVGTLLNLALCYERQGKVASAWSKYREAAAAARSANQTDRDGMARQRASALESRLSRLTVTVPTAIASSEGLEVRLDGVAIPASLWNVAAPVDPGDHTVEVSAKGKKPWSTRVQVAPPANPTVTVPGLENGPVEPTPALASAADGEPVRAKNPQRIIALAVGGAGVVGIAVGSAFGLSAKSTYQKADSACSANNVCTASGEDTRNEAFDKATVSTIAFGLGGTALAAGAILWFTAPKNPDPSDPPRVGVAFGPSSLVVRGTW